MNRRRKVFSQYEVDLSGCWLYVGRIDRDGYGRCSKGTLAHRVFYEHFVGPIPSGCEIHHDCEMRRCVNPDHLRPVTRPEHISITPNLGWKRDVTHCPQGHEYSPENTCRSNGRRYCLTCNRFRCNDYYRRKNTKMDSRWTQSKETA